ncbi:tetratricopeptide repeat protein [bacterium]|nr:tetratricopeptide repeat protein [bacterium]
MTTTACSQARIRNGPTLARSRASSTRTGHGPIRTLSERTRSAMSRPRKQPHDRQRILEAAVAALERQDFPTAERNCRILLQGRRTPAAVHHVLGVALVRQGANDEGLEQLRAAVQKDPRNVGFLDVLAQALTECEQIHEALRIYGSALEIDPRNVPVLVHTGQLLRRFGRPQAAMRKLKAALDVDPRNLEALITAGDVFFEIGDSRQALRCFDLALKLEPTHLVCQCNRAFLLECNGQREEAAAGYRRVLETDPQNVYAHMRLAGIEPATSDDPRLDVLEDLARTGSLHTVQASQLHFTLGSLHDAAGDVEAAFGHYVTANRKRAEVRGNDFDLDRFEREVDAFCAGFTAAFFDDPPGTPTDSDVPVFVVGMPRSGTTLVESIIDAHGQAAGAGELPHLRAIRDQLIGDLADDPAGRLTATDPTLLAEAARQYLALLRMNHPDARRIVDKMPHNFMNLFLVPVLFRGARIVHCRRDARDTCLSCFFTDFAQGHGYRNDLTTLGRYYRLYERLMDHWRRTVPTPMLEVQYEELVTDPEAGARRLVEFLGLEWQPTCLDFPMARRMVRTASTSQVRRGVYRSSSGRWKRYEAQLAPLIAALDGVAG